MILKRVVEHMKQQQWSAVVIELTIVVLGVFIGLQVNNWNDDVVTGCANRPISKASLSISTRASFRSPRVLD